MNTKALYSAIAIIALLIVALLIYNQSQERNQLQSEAVNNSTTNQVNQSNTNTVDEMAPMESSESMAPQNTNMVPAEEGRFSGEGDIQAPDVAVFEITYDGTTFSAPSDI